MKFQLRDERTGNIYQTDIPNLTSEEYNQLGDDWDKFIEHIECCYGTLDGEGHKENNEWVYGFSSYEVPQDKFEEVLKILASFLRG